MASAFKERSFARGATLFAEDAPAQSMLVLGSGKVLLRTNGPGGEEISLGELGPSDYLGETCLVQTGQRMCTAVAVEPVSALELEHAEFQKLLAQKPQAGIKLLLAVFQQFAAKVSENRALLRAAVQKK
jgi:CRP-like cAMP-binding protein